MKRLILLIFIFSFSHCSFDNKSGIWKNNEAVDQKKVNRFKDFETLYTEEKSFNKIIKPTNKLKILLDPIKITKKWPDEFFYESNNFGYENQNELIFKSKKLSGHRVNDKILFDGENIILGDNKGNITVYSVNEKKTIFKYNFYKKKFKKIKKKLSLAIENNIIYTADNLGYLYSIDYRKKKLLWAKDLKIPFRSNLKLVKNKIIVADQNNTFYVFNKFNGSQLKFVPTEETIIKNDFINSIVLYKNSFIYLNTFGSLYSINNQNLEINWFSNLKRSFDLNPTDLFFSNPVIAFKDKIILSTDPYLYVLNIYNGSIIFKLPITSIVEPIVSGKNLFIITKDNLLVGINIDSGTIIYSVDIEQEIADFLDSKNKSIDIKSLSLANNNLLVFLNNSYLVSFRKNGKIEDIKKLKEKLGTFPIFIDKSILFLNNKNRLVVLN